MQQSKYNDLYGKTVEFLSVKNTEGYELRYVYLSSVVYFHSSYEVSRPIYGKLGGF